MVLSTTKFQEEHVARMLGTNYRGALSAPQLSNQAPVTVTETSELERGDGASHVAPGDATWEPGDSKFGAVRR